MLNPGETTQIQGSGAKPYTIKNVDGMIWSCTCPAWRNSGGKVDQKTCKHVQKVRGTGPQAVQPRPAPWTAPQVTTPTGGPGGPVAAIRDPDGHTTGRVITADPEYAQTILDRALAEGRKLRQDEKTKLFGPPVLLAHKFEDFDDLDPTNWWYSEKLDGVRAYWNGSDFISRQGNVFQAPSWFKAALPKNEILDGELWIGRQMFQKTISVVSRDDWGDGAKQVKYVIFDVPSRKNDGFEGRLNCAVNHAVAANVPHVMAHPHSLVQSRSHLLAELKRVAAAGAEGLMIRKPGSLYEVGRSNTLLKVKPFQDTEGLIIAHKPGQGRHKGVLGAVVLRLASGVEFDLGTGFTDEERRNPPAIGTEVTFRYTELTEDGKPKCTSYICPRNYE